MFLFQVYNILDFFLHILSFTKNGQAVLEHFLTGDIFAKAEDCTLSRPDWEICKAAVLVKSYFFKVEGDQGLETTIREVTYKRYSTLGWYHIM